MVSSILIVDDNAHIRKALCDMFKREEDFNICGEAENGREANREGAAVAARFGRLRHVDARDEWPRCGPRAETFAAEGAADNVQRFR